MKEIFSFLLKLAIPFILVAIGVFVMGAGLEQDIPMLTIGGLISCVAGLLYGAWLYISNGLSLFDD